MTDNTPALVALLEAIDPRIAVFDGSPQGALAGPQMHVHGGTRTPENRRYCVGTPNRGTVWLVVCVSNSSQGARLIANKATDKVDDATGGKSADATAKVDEAVDAATDKL